MHRRHLESISGLRAIAVLSVVLFHVNASWVPGGFVGVDIFFVISGFVVAHSVAGGSYPTFGTYIASFYKRRFQRILPAALTYILFALLISIAFIPIAQPTTNFELTGASAVFGLSNIELFLHSKDYFSADSSLNPFTHTWSLAVEEQYYLLFPLFSYLALIDGQSRSKRRVGLAFVAGASLVSLAASVWLTARSPSFAFYMLPGRFWELGLGFVTRIAVASYRPTEIKTGRVTDIVGLAGFGTLIVSLFATDETRFPFPGALLPCLSTAAIIAIVWWKPRSLPDKMLSNRGAVFFGQISYSLYLWHWGVLVLMRWTLGLDTFLLQMGALVLSVLLGWLSYVTVERAFHNPKKRGVSPNAKFFAGYAAATCSVCALAVGLFVAKPLISFSRTAQANIWNPYISPGVSSVCASKRVEHLGAGLHISFVGNCLKPGAPRLYVLGDSHAGAYLRSLWRLAGEGRVEPHLLTLGGCDLIRVTQTESVKGCVAFLERARAMLKAKTRAGDVIFLAGLHTPRYLTVGVASKPLDPMAMERSRAALLSLRLSTSAAIILEGAKPVVAAPQYRCADWFDKNNPACRPLQTISALENWRRVAAIEPGLERIANQVPGVLVWRPANLLCESQSCPGYHHGRPLYADTDHLTAYGNDVLLPSLKQQVYAAARSDKASSASTNRQIGSRMADSQ